MLPRVTRRQSITWWGAGGALLLFAVTGLIGALVKADQPQQTWRVSVLSASVATDRPPLQRAEQASRWLVVRARVEPGGTSSQRGLGSAMRLSGVDGLLKQQPEVVLLRDDSLIDQLHPGMPEELAFAWEQGAASSVPQQVTLEIPGQDPVSFPVTAS
jgi:hypothetical protein